MYKYVLVLLICLLVIEGADKYIREQSSHYEPSLQLKPWSCYWPFFWLFLLSNPNALPGYSCHSHPRRGHEGSRLEELLRSPDSRDVLRRLAEDGVKLRLLTKLTIQMKIEEMQRWEEWRGIVWYSKACVKGPLFSQKVGESSLEPLSIWFNLHLLCWAGGLPFTEWMETWSLATQEAPNSRCCPAFFWSVLQVAINIGQVRCNNSDWWTNSMFWIVSVRFWFLWWIYSCRFAAMSSVVRIAVRVQNCCVWDC